jgi:predicted phosphodiesterase
MSEPKHVTRSIQVSSDIHLEMYDKNVSITDILIPCADYLVLSGDIGYPLERNYYNFLKQCSESFEKVFVITGNHEYYSKLSMITIDNQIQQICDNFDNVYFLNNDIYNDEENSGYTFIGTTMWSRIDKYKEFAIHNTMNDYRLIYNGHDAPIIPNDINKLYDKNLEWLTKSIAEHKDKKIIIITHHMPSFNFIDDKYKRSPVNSAYASNLEQLVQDNDNIKYWIFGHTHSSVFAKINKCEYICNPIGYLETDKSIIGSNNVENEAYDKQLIYYL